MPTFDTIYRLGYQDLGSGPPVLLIHAFPLNAESWQGQAQALLPERRVLIPDLPGFGSSGPPPPNVTLRDVAEALVALLRHLKLSEVAAVGQSIGGYLLMEMAKLSPGVFGKALLANTRATPDSEQGKAGREAFAKRAERQGVSWVADEMLPKLLRPDPAPEVARRARSIIDQSTPQGLAAMQRAMAGRPDYRPSLASFACPTLVLAGAEDAIITAQDSADLASRLSAPLEVLASAGHLSNLDEEPGFNRVLVSFLVD
jgi:pimeloyl-ACP methyl ester carboxylesterase